MASRTLSEVGRVPRPGGGGPAAPVATHHSQAAALTRLGRRERSTTTCCGRSRVARRRTRPRAPGRPRARRAGRGEHGGQLLAGLDRGPTGAPISTPAAASTVSSTVLRPAPGEPRRPADGERVDGGHVPCLGRLVCWPAKPAGPARLPAPSLDVAPALEVLAARPSASAAPCAPRRATRGRPAGLLRERRGRPRACLGALAAEHLPGLLRLRAGRRLVRPSGRVHGRVQAGRRRS